MRDSSLEWVRHIPERWGTPSLGSVFDIQLGKMLNPGATSSGEQHPYLRNLNVQWDRLDLDDVVGMHFDAADRIRYALKDGDLLVCEGGEVGRAAIWHEDLPECYYQKALHRVRPRGNDSTRFLMYALMAAASLGVFENEGNTSTFVHLTAEKLRAHRLPWPPVNEQRSIVDYLDAETAQINHLAASTTTMIDLLAARRGAETNAALMPASLPTGWAYRKLKRVATLRSGDAITADSIEPAGAFPVYGGNGIRGHTSRYNYEGAYPLLGRQGALCGNVNFASGRFWAAELFAFIADTQSKAWERLVQVHGGPDGARQQFADRLAKQIDERGTVDVLRHGVNDHGIEVRLAFFKPAHGLTPELTEHYLANRLTVTRQLPYDAAATKTLDLCLFVNGIPVATAELKNPLTHQTVEHAKVQYRTDRDPTNVTLSRRALVHFVVDPELVEMTTCLAGPKTRFLPFNRGNAGGKGNPPDPDGHRTSYLWEQVWARDAWLDLLGRFVHILPGDGPTKAAQLRNGSTIFPRYHQWDAVRRLEAAAREEGPGQSYLVQHSAGSGKSNTIAWLAHRLMSLHGADDRPVFDKVVVITDRVILDKQLQETIYQFEHATGVVAKIDQDSSQLAEALKGEQARIVITTLQKFPFILDKVKDLGQRRFAVIVDEAHSSQTGESAKEMKAALGSASAEAQLELAEKTDSAEAPVEPQDALAATVAARGRQPNLSFFAFTATPKARTLLLFGRENAEGLRVPFHLYSMRQAIEEGFILDVLANYTTYATYWKVGKAVADDPEYDTRLARRSIARFVSLHPHNLAQKAEIIVEHFREHTRHKIAGKGKAMVVTSSRLHAVRYKQAIDLYIGQRGYTDLQALVAFSGRVDDSGLDFTESGMNGFPESQTAQRFGGPEYGVLIVAEKFQTGYDQPLLHTMFVDKVLVGLAAVQTLSRLNRIHPDKTDTFVLDFRNEADDITESFRPWYEATSAVPTDPNLLHDMADRLLGLQVLDADQARAVGALIADRTKRVGDHGAVYALLALAVERFSALVPEQQDEVRDALDGFVRAYSFLSQVVDFGDVGLEALYLASRALIALLPTDRGGRLDLGSEVELTHLRLEKTSESAITPDHGVGELSAIYSGKGRDAEEERDRLSAIIEVLNERFGLKLGTADQLFFDQLEATWLADDHLMAQARANPIENFALVFSDLFIKSIVGRMDDNQDLFQRVLDEPAFHAIVRDYYLERVFAQARADG